MLVGDRARRGRASPGTGRARARRRRRCSAAGTMADQGRALHRDRAGAPARAAALARAAARGARREGCAVAVDVNARPRMWPRAEPAASVPGARRAGVPRSVFDAGAGVRRPLPPVRAGGPREVQRRRSRRAGDDGARAPRAPPPRGDAGRHRWRAGDAPARPRGRGAPSRRAARASAPIHDGRGRRLLRRGVLASLVWERASAVGDAARSCCARWRGGTTSRRAWVRAEARLKGPRGQRGRRARAGAAGEEGEARSAGRRAPWRSALLGGDRDLDRRRDGRGEADHDGWALERPIAVGLDAAPVDAEALRGERLFDVARRDRAGTACRPRRPGG